MICSFRCTSGTQHFSLFEAELTDDELQSVLITLSSSASAPTSRALILMEITLSKVMNWKTCTAVAPDKVYSCNRKSFKITPLFHQHIHVVCEVIYIYILLSCND